MAATEVASTLPTMLSGAENKGLLKQDLASLDVTKLTPLTPEVISRQATINIGTIGHVAHGKSTVVRALSGVQTVRFKDEIERNITIKLGYANAKIYKSTDPDLKRPSCYFSFGSSKEDSPMLPGHKFPLQLLRHVSFVDCPGHDILMATMLNGAAVMDAALLLIAGNEPCPQPQTSEHLAAVDLMGLRNLIVLQNKIDLVDEEAAKQQYREIRSFVHNTPAEHAPIVPICAQLKYNLDVVAELIATKIPVPVRDFVSSPRMIVIRSFDINRPGELISNLRGGVAGGTILRGVLKVGQEIEIRPGLWSRDKATGEIKCTPIITKVVSLFAENNELQYAVPGGLIGVGTLVDPTLTRADRLVGHVLGSVGTLPMVYTQLTLSYFLVRRLLGVRGADTGHVQKLAIDETLLLNIGSTSTGARITALDKSADGVRLCTVTLTSPVCTEIGEKVALSRRINRNWRLIGWGVIHAGVTIPLS